MDTGMDVLTLSYIKVMSTYGRPELSFGYEEATFPCQKSDFILFMTSRCPSTISCYSASASTPGSDSHTLLSDSSCSPFPCDLNARVHNPPASTSLHPPTPDPLAPSRPPPMSTCVPSTFTFAQSTWVPYPPKSPSSVQSTRGKSQVTCQCWCPSLLLPRHNTHIRLMKQGGRERTSPPQTHTQHFDYEVHPSLMMTRPIPDHQTNNDPLTRPIPDHQTNTDPLTRPTSDQLSPPDPLTKSLSHQSHHHPINPSHLTSPATDIRTIPSRFQSPREGASVPHGNTSDTTYLWPTGGLHSLRESSIERLRNTLLLPLLLLLLLLCPTTAVKEGRPSLSAPKQNLTVVAGRKAILTCLVDNLGPHQVAWTRYGWRGRAVLTVDASVMTKNPRVSLQQDRSGLSWSLVIDNLTTSDQGHYSCEVNTVPRQRLNYYITVQVPPRFVTPPQDQTAREGEEVELGCEATGDPQPVLTWRREDGGPFRLNHTQVEEAPGMRLLLSSVSRDDGGAFLCVASNGVPPAVSARAQVSILFAPEMVGGGGVVWAEAGRTATLECHYRAYPEPSVTWTKDGALVTHLGSSRERYSRGAGTSTLVLRSVDTDNFGHYRCSAENHLGSNSTLLTLVEMSTTTTTTTPSPPTTTTTAAVRSKDHYHHHQHSPSRDLNKITRLANSSSSSLLRMRGVPPPGGPGPTEATLHRYIQEAAPPSSVPYTEPPIAEVASVSGVEEKCCCSLLTLLTVFCIHHLLSVYPAPPLLLHLTC